MSNRAVLILSFALTLGACGGGTSAPPSDDRPEIAIQVGADGYHPAEISAPAGRPVRVVVTRTSDEGCGQQVVFPDLGVRRDLPLGEPVSADITMPASGSVHFTCGMAMYQGSIVAR